MTGIRSAMWKSRERARKKRRRKNQRENQGERIRSAVADAR